MKLFLSTLSVALLLTSCGSNPTPQPNAQANSTGIHTTYTGLKHKLLRAGEGGRTPNSLSTVTAHYTGKTLDGEVFDSSYKRGEPSEFAIDEVIQGWTEGLQLMTVGEKRRFWIPANLAYGESPSGGRPGGELIFDIELISYK